MLDSLVNIDGSTIIDWDSFHDVFAKAFGFPEFYGRNMDAWIDCMTALDVPEDGMTTVYCEPGTLITIEITNAKSLERRCPEQFSALVDCIAFVNWRRIESGGQPVLTLSYFK